MTAAMQNPVSQSLHSDLKYIIFFQSKCYFSIQWASSFSTNWINLKLLIQKRFLNVSLRIQHDRRDKESSSFPVTISCVHRPTSAWGPQTVLRVQVAQEGTNSLPFFFPYCKQGKKIEQFLKHKEVFFNIVFVGQLNAIIPGNEQKK